MSSSLLLYRRLLSYVRPYWWAFALAVVGMVVVAAGDVVMAYMVMPIIQKLQHPDPETTLRLPLAVVAVFLLRGLGSFISEYGMAWTGHRVVFDLRREMIDRLLALPTPFYDSQSSGRLISKFTFDAYQLAAATSSAITTAVRSTLTIAGSLGFLFWLNWKLTLISIVAFPLVAWPRSATSAGDCGVSPATCSSARARSRKYSKRSSAGSASSRSSAVSNTSVRAPSAWPTACASR